MDFDMTHDVDDDAALLLPFVEALYDASGFGSSFVAANGDDDDGKLGNSEGGDAQERSEHSPPPLPTSHSRVSELRLAPPSVSRATTQQASKKTPLRWNSNKARDERKGELIYLRKKVAELEAKLCSFVNKRPRLAPIGAAGAACARDETSHSSLAIANVWKEIASQQNEERVKAEHENVRLKILLENQLKIAKSLEKILNKKSTAKDIEEFAGRSKMRLQTVDATDANLFNSLLSEVELLFSQLDGIFEANGLAHTETSVTNARIRFDAHCGVSSEIIANKLLPFDLHATGDAAWHYYTFAKEKAPFRSYQYQYTSNKSPHASDDMVVENFIVKLNAKGTDANLRCKQILRRRVEQDRVVIVWRSAVEAFEFSDEPVTGVRFYQDGYIVIKRPSTISGGHTLVQSCCILTPDLTRDLAGRNHPRVRAITNFLMVSTAAYISSAHQMIENVLIEEALRRTSVQV